MPDSENGCLVSAGACEARSSNRNANRGWLALSPLAFGTPSTRFANRVELLFREYSPTENGVK
jgi:hypothetical protein